MILLLFLRNMGINNKRLYIGSIDIKSHASTWVHFHSYKNYRNEVNSQDSALNILLIAEMFISCSNLHFLSQFEL